MNQFLIFCILCIQFYLSCISRTVAACFTFRCDTQKISKNWGKEKNWFWKIIFFVHFGKKENLEKPNKTKKKGKNYRARAWNFTENFIIKIFSLIEIIKRKKNANIYIKYRKFLLRENIIKIINKKKQWKIKKRKNPSEKSIKI